MLWHSGYVLKLKRSLHGLRQSPLNWFLELKSRLEARGFKQATIPRTDIAIGPCLFESYDVICLVYVDDCLFFAKDETSIDWVLK